MLKPYLKYIYYIGAVLIVMFVSNAFVTWQNTQVSKYAYKNPQLIIIQKTITLKKETRIIEAKKDVDIDERKTIITPEGNTEILEKGIKEKSESKIDENIASSETKDSKEKQTPILPSFRELLIGLQYIHLGIDQDLIGIKADYNIIDNLFIGAGIFGYWKYQPFGDKQYFTLETMYKFKL